MKKFLAILFGALFLIGIIVLTVVQFDYNMNHPELTEPLYLRHYWKELVIGTLFMFGGGIPLFWMDSKKGKK